MKEIEELEQELMFGEAGSPEPSEQPKPESDDWPGVEAWEARLRELAKSDTDVRWKLGEWLLLGEGYSKSDADSRWKIGDQLASGEAHYPSAGGETIGGHYSPILDAYTTAEMITGLARKTLIDLASTARRCHATVRTDELTWSHHRVLINARPDADDEELRTELRAAVGEKLTVATFKEKLKSRKSPVKSKTFLVEVPLDVWEFLKDLADDEPVSVQRYASDLLVGFAASDEAAFKRSLAKSNVAERRHKQRQRAGRKTARSYDPLGLRR